MGCFFPVGRALMFPPEKLRQEFGAEDASYAWKVFLKHFSRLQSQGFEKAENVLEIGPGRNIGTALLLQSLLSSRQGNAVSIVCWDVFKNASPEEENFWPKLAQKLLDSTPTNVDLISLTDLDELLKTLHAITKGSQPLIEYRVEPLTQLAAWGVKFDLIYSHAAIEHVWFIDEFWDKISALTGPLGWHSHRIDLADHGRRYSNYVEMLQWSDWAYWATQRYIPGATNRWRASHHRRKINEIGLNTMTFVCELRDTLPVPRSWLSHSFRHLDESDLRCTAFDVVARKIQLERGRNTPLPRAEPAP